MNRLKQTAKTFTIKKGYLPEVGSRREYCIITNDAVKIYSMPPSVTPTPIDERPIYYKNGKATKKSMIVIILFKLQIANKHLRLLWSLHLKFYLLMIIMRMQEVSLDTGP